MIELSQEQVRWSRLRRSGLVEPFATPEAAAQALAGIQAQVLPAAGLALWNRTGGLTWKVLEHLLYEKRSLVKLWGQRGTLHVYASEDWPWIHSVLADQPTWWQRRFLEEGGDAETYQAIVAQAAAALRQRGTMGRKDLRDAVYPLTREMLSSWGGLFADLVQLGLACHARPQGSEGRFAHRAHWLPQLAWSPPPASQANVELARRYLHAYGPATATDLAYWRGARVGEARRWIAALDDEVVEVGVDGREMLALRADLEALSEASPPREAWPVRLLYRFDPLLLGLKDKGWIAAPEHYRRVWRPAGAIEGTLLEHGGIAGTWRYDRRGKGLAISVAAFAPLSGPVRAAVEGVSLGIAQFFGLELAQLQVA